MPASFERKVKARGGAKGYRVKRLTKNKLLVTAIVRKAGPEGGHTVSYVKEQKRAR